MFGLRKRFDPRARFRVTSWRGVDLGDRKIPVGELIPEGALDHMQLLALYTAAVIDPITAQEVPDDPTPYPDEEEIPDAATKPKSRRRRAA